jgi:cell division protease FtsH
MPGRPGCRGSVLIWVLIVIAVAPLIYALVSSSFGGPTRIAYSAFRQQLEAGNVEQVTITGHEIQGTLKQPAELKTAQGATTQYTSFVTFVPSFGNDGLLSQLESQEVQIQTQPQSSFSWLTLVLYLLPTLLLLGAGYWLYRRSRSGGGQGMFSILSMRRSGAKTYDPQKQRTTFDDVAGAEGPKTELEEVIGFLRHPHRFEHLGGEMPKGVLLVGPPGTGKTLLARAVAGEADVPFLSITGSDFMEMFVGVGASRVRDLFEKAEHAAPSIIFIDELDSIGRRRGAGLGGGHDEREQTLNQLLSEMDGFEPNVGVIVMAATNRPDILDPALLRPGRFDRRIEVSMPTMPDRHAILKIHARNKPLADDVDLERVARGTPGFSGADLENLLNEAALLAARKGQDSIHRADIEDARDKVLMGLERTDLALTEDELRMLAYHEGGHAVLAAVLPNADPILKVTIVPRGRAMGVTQQLPERDKYIYTQEYMLDRLVVMMGGRAAENLVFNTSTSGAEDDLRQATRLVRKMVLDWGMSERLGHLSFGGERENVFLGEQIAQRREYSEDTARKIDEEVKSILDDSYQRAVNTLQEHREALDRLADALVEKEEIPGEDVLSLIGVQEDEGQVAADQELASEPAAA